MTWKWQGPGLKPGQRPEPTVESGEGIKTWEWQGRGLRPERKPEPTVEQGPAERPKPAVAERPEATVESNIRVGAGLAKGQLVNGVSRVRLGRFERWVAGITAFGVLLA